jgi:hypothetical protein
MQKVSKNEATRHLGGSAAQASKDLQRFGKSAQVLAYDRRRVANQYNHKWVGIYDGVVAASGRSLRDVLLKLRKKAIPTSEAIVRFVDKKEATLIL